MADVEQATKNPISRLQEICQQWKFPVPTYREAEGTMQEFGTEVVVRIQGEELRFHARGRTKKTSKAKVAQLVIDYITEHCPELLEPPALPDVDESVMSGNKAWRKGDQVNKQHAPTMDMKQLAMETERLDHVHVGLDFGKLLQQCRLNLRLSQRDLAARVNEKVNVIVEYESGKALPNQQIITKLERALGVHLRGQNAGQPKAFGRGRGRGL